MTIALGICLLFISYIILARTIGPGDLRKVAEFKKVFLLFSPMLDTHVMNLGQIAHKLWILSLFFLFTTFGDERVAKN